MNSLMKDDVRILLKMLAGRSREGSHRERLEDFYAPQAAQYDAFRERLLHGRRELLEQMRISPDLSVIELGGGTGHNLKYLGYPLHQFKRIEIVDLCPSLLAVAADRYRHMDNIKVIEADAATYRPAKPVDRVYFSYALTMVPDWKRAIDNALAMLKPGGMLGVVDFYVSAERVAGGGKRHNPLTRKFWQHWFAHDGVMLSPQHLVYLQSVCRTGYLQESHGSVPYLPLIKAPYYIHVGEKVVSFD